MCGLDKMIYCQLSFAPLARNEYGSDVKRVLRIISDSGLEHEAGVMSTVVRGKEKELFRLMQKIYEDMDNFCSFIMDIKISNVCGC